MMLLFNVSLLKNNVCHLRRLCWFPGWFKKTRQSVLHCVLRLRLKRRSRPLGDFGAPVWGCWWYVEDVSFCLSDYLTAFINARWQTAGRWHLFCEQLYLTDVEVLWAWHRNKVSDSSALIPHWLTFYRLVGCFIYQEWSGRSVKSCCYCGKTDFECLIIIFNSKCQI